MLSTVRVTRALAFRGITTSAAQKDYIYYPGYMMSLGEHRKFLLHPNRNPDNQETYFHPFPQAPKWADKDPELNAILKLRYYDYCWGCLRHAR